MTFGFTFDSAAARVEYAALFVLLSGGEGFSCSLAGRELSSALLLVVVSVKGPALYSVCDL